VAVAPGAMVIGPTTVEDIRKRGTANSGEPARRIMEIYLAKVTPMLEAVERFIRPKRSHSGLLRCRSAGIARQSPNLPLAGEGTREIGDNETHMVSTIREQIQTIFREDPAAKSVLEIILCYPGFHAILLHRFSHWLHGIGLPLIPRVISQVSRLFTGIEIHPGARIGRRFFIDHGMGVVIGETTEIGDDVLLYQGVTLGGTGKDCGKRHPTIGNQVVIGTGAKVLGNIQIGDDVKIGAGSVVVHPVPPHSTVVGIPGRVVRKHGVSSEGEMLEHGHLPDPEAQEMEEMRRRLTDLEEKLQRVLADRTPV
jgi:serine O-acetyltransferase